MSGTLAMFPAPSPVLQFFDASGTPLAGGLLFCYEAGTTTKQACFTDASGTTPLPNPIVLNARGEIAPDGAATSCGLWMDPTLAYKFVLSPLGDSDPPSNPIWTVDSVVSAEYAVLKALQGMTAGLTGVSVGCMMPFGGLDAPAGWLLCDGSPISRTTYSALFDVIGTNYGAGDGTTTFNVPDKRGRASFGADTLGGAAANRITIAGSGVDASRVGNTGGNEMSQSHNHTLHDPGHSHGFNDPGHHHQQFYTGSFPGFGPPEGGVNHATGPGTRSPDMQTDDATTGMTFNSATTGITIDTYGAGATQNIPPCEFDSWIIFAGV